MVEEVESVEGGEDCPDSIHPGVLLGDLREEVDEGSESDVEEHSPFHRAVGAVTRAKSECIKHYFNIILV